MGLNERKLDKYRVLRRDVEEDYINIHPIQRGGILTPEARKALLEFGDGYSVCDFCLEGRLDLIETPPIHQFMDDLAKFLDMDVARVTPGCRQAKYVVFNALGDPDETIVIDSNAHYTTYVGAERAKLNIVEVPHNGYPEFGIKPESYSEKIDEVEDETGNPPVLLLATHVDYRYGNFIDAKKVGKISKKSGVPFLLNAAYTVGRMPISGKELNADFITGSGHKSMAAAAPTGVLATTDEWADVVFKQSTIQGDWSGRSFGVKEVEFLGCTVMGAPIITLMASFPAVVERTKRWDEEVKKAQHFVKNMEKIEGIKQLGNRPTQHDLNMLETPSFHKIAHAHPRKGFFLYEELREHGVWGVQPGLSKKFKSSTYGLTREQIDRVIEAFYDIAKKYDLAIT